MAANGDFLRARNDDLIIRNGERDFRRRSYGELGASDADSWRARQCSCGYESSGIDPDAIELSISQHLALLW